MAKVKRKAPAARRSAAARGRASKARRAKARTGSVLDSVMAILPFTEDQFYRIGLAIILGAAVALAWFVASLAGLPAMAQYQVAGLASDAGFEARRFVVRGVDRMNEQKVYERVLDAREQPMPLVDLGELREELLDLPWVKDARVSRQLPDTVIADIVERTPHAVLARGEDLVLIDADGVVLEPISRKNASGMLIISGPGAHRQVAALDNMLDAAPALRSKIAEAEWIGNRRWDIVFDTDQKLALPEGRDAASSALVSFATLDGRNRLLGGKVVKFDMRDNGRIYMRIPGRSQQTLETGDGS